MRGAPDTSHGRASPRGSSAAAASSAAPSQDEGTAMAAWIRVRRRRSPSSRAPRASRTPPERGRTASGTPCAATWIHRQALGFEARASVTPRCVCDSPVRSVRSTGGAAPTRSRASASLEGSSGSPAGADSGQPISSAPDGAVGAVGAIRRSAGGGADHGPGRGRPPPGPSPAGGAWLAFRRTRAAGAGLRPSGRSRAARHPSARADGATASRPAAGEAGCAAARADRLGGGAPSAP